MVITIITIITIMIIITSLWSRSWLWWCRYEGAGCGLSGALQGCKVIFKFLIFHHFPFVWTPNWRVLIIRQLQIFSASQSRHLYCVLQSLWFYTGETGIGIIPLPIECLNPVFWKCIFVVYRFSALTISCSVNLAQKKSKQKENQLPITPAIFCDC